MRKDDLVYVAHSLATARRVADKVRGVDRRAFDADENLRLALVHLLQVIGETAARVSPIFREAHPSVPWKAMAGMRNRIVHDYLNVDDDIVWRTATVEVPALVKSLEGIKPASS